MKIPINSKWSDDMVTLLRVVRTSIETDINGTREFVYCARDDEEEITVLVEKTAFLAYYIEVK
jgi:hypothetical protein